MKARIGWGIALGTAALAGAGFGCSETSGAPSIGSETGQAQDVGQVTQAVNSLGTDPGPRGGPAAAGSFFPGLNATEQAAFVEALDTFSEVDSVSGAIEEGSGLGPTFNGDSCAMCHAQPSVGGTSPSPFSPQHPMPNPQVALATKDGATNTVPSFITANGPIREARFIAVSSANNAPLDGGVHGLYTIKGRTDAPGCNLAQPNFAAQLTAHNVIFRIPTPLFGLGLVENTSDEALQANLAANRNAKVALGINGRFNTSGNDGTITKFGWKAQNKSLTIFAGEAYNVEQGVTNEGFTNERSAVPGCVFNPLPEDPLSTNEGSSDIVQFANFMRMTAPPTPAIPSAAATRGSTLFDSVGCVHCHSRNLTSGPSQITSMSNVTYHPFSDFAIHHMGSTLADGTSQGAAIADEFRTAPLWGVGQRLFFLHDGRTSNLGAAIEAHSSPTNTCTTVQNYEQFNANGTWFQPFTSFQVCGEANAVVNNYNALSAAQQSDLLAFLRSL